ncbi:MAG: hypothetical protein ACREDT_01585 [Methylocella sp.]
MKQKFRLFAIILFSIAATGAATAAYTAPAQPQTRVETDQKTGAVLFIVNGREQARINGAGLHVRQSVDYGGGIIDQGEAGYDDRQARASRAK